MRFSGLRRKRVLIPAVAALTTLAVGATVWTATADEVGGDERADVAAAATDAAGGGEAVEVERSDDPGEAYEVEVRLEDGREVDVTLDDDLAVVAEERDDEDDDRDDRDDGARDGRDADDRVLADAERADAEDAALTAVGGGTLLDLEASDDPGVAYEAEVRDRQGVEWDIELDADYTVVDKRQDR
ncbi:hypothetical protein FXB39_00760 [Nocardioides sp. BGMRC 2183]|nr:hypothetical protein FXB39_00760 [Nocardioides sp. BGMRC 2183]